MKPWFYDPNWWVAIGTAILAVATIFLFVYTLRLWRTTQQSLRLAHREFLVVHRPRLLVRNISLFKPAHYHDYFKPDIPPSGRFYVENTGGSTADVIDSYCDVYWTDEELPMQRPYEEKIANSAVPAGMLEAGLSISAAFTAPVSIPCHINEISNGRGGWKFFVLGWIDYRDNAGTRYRTEFCRRWHAQERRFVPVSNADYERG